MVEFAILLIVIMSLCAGMIYVSRLLTLQYWAQQDARLIAFEQTWAPTLGRELGGADANFDVNNHNILRRPGSAKNAGVQRTLRSNPESAGMDDIFARLISPLSPNDRGSVPATANSGEPVMLAKAKDSIWERRSSDWVRDLDNIALVASAYAGQLGSNSSVSDTEIEPRGNDGFFDPQPRSERRVRGLTNLLERSGFGRRLCRRVELLLDTKRIPAPKNYIEKDCPQSFDSAFGRHLAANLNFAEMFRGYSVQLEGGAGTTDALQNIIQEVVAHEVYSFFDQKVRNSYSDAPGDTSEFNTEVVTLLSDNQEFLRLFELEYQHYLGQIMTLSEFRTSLTSLSDWDPESRDVVGLKDLEEDIGDVMFDDASEDFPVAGANGFWMTASGKLPVPTLTDVIGPLFDTFAIQFFSEESDLIDPLINESAKDVEVIYDPTPVTFDPAKRRFDTDGRRMRAKFYLLTQPWHIPRRIHDDPLDMSYRELGGQLDDKSGSSDEAILRRRVWGMYIVPSEPLDFLNLLTAIMPGDFVDLSFINDFADILQPMDDTVSLMKEGLLNSKLNDLLDFLDNLPFMSLEPFKLPEWPAVRPDTYPGTVELKNDELAGEERDFGKYLNEQKQNPKPDPKYN